MIDEPWEKLFMSKMENKSQKKMRVSGFWGVETPRVALLTTLSYILTIALYYCQQSSIFPSIELNVL